MHRRAEVGSALLLATLIAMLLASMATLMITQSLSARRATQESVSLIEARLVAMGAIAETMVRLDLDEQMPSIGIVFQGTDGTIVTRQDQTGLIDINSAQPVDLVRLLEALGAHPDVAFDLANLVVDWRDEDDLNRAARSERTAYASEGLPPPGNRPFRVEFEISAVMGFDPALATCIASFLTTYNPGSVIDTGAAPPFIKAALELPSDPARASIGLPFGRVVRLDALVPLSAQSVFRRSVWVRLTGNRDHPFLIHRVTEGLDPANMVRPTTCSFAERNVG